MRQLDTSGEVLKLKNAKMANSYSQLGASRLSYVGILS